MGIIKIVSWPALIYEYAYKCFDRILMYSNINRFSKCGKNVKFFPISSSFIYKNIYIGNDVHIGERASFMTFIAKLYIGNKVMFGPNVTIRGGIHPYYISGRFLFDIGEDEKNIEDDKDVFIEDDVWIGCNVIILKGVRVGRGAIIAAGSVVTKNISPYTIAGGIPAKKIGNRFKNIEETLFHDTCLYEEKERLNKSTIEKEFLSYWPST